MGSPAARQGERIVALDMHLIEPPGPTAPVMAPYIPSCASFVTPLEHHAKITCASNTVPINGRAADPAQSCDETGNIGAKVVAAGTVTIGG